MTNLIFMGSPQFAVPTLEALARTYTVLAVYTQPDKPAGRGKTLTAVPVAQWAAARGLPIYQPRSFRKDPAAIEQLHALQPDVVVVAAYGLILPQAVLDIPRFGCVNVHGSILPRHRGAAPIAAAILAGDAETGITIMQMDAGMDTGPMLSVGREPIRSDDTTASLSERLSYLGAQLLIDTLPGYLSGAITPQVQPTEGITYSPKINKADAQIDWGRSAIEIDRAVRAYIPWPGAFTWWNGQMVKILKTGMRDEGSGIGDRGSGIGDQGSGTVVRLADGAIGVVTGDGVIELIEIQLAGRKAMSARDFVRGQPGFINAQFTMHNE
ncbi:MAG: methionyl-tRNA formyltransferase [Chloroflexi bacterium]|nr:methionyl-tRNA formyltransferase [Chloroflexota bacterium]